MSRPTSFYYSFLVLPREQREAIIAVWDLCRAVDDVVDEPQDPAGPPPQALLDGWRAELSRVFDGATPGTPQGRGLQPWVRRFDLPRRPFEDLVDGVEMDLRRSRYETFADLYEYCWRVAATVGLVCIRIFGCRSDAAPEYATNLGVALQLTNIARDVGTDLDRDRVYLPREDLARFGCGEDDLRAGRVTAPVRAVLEFQCARAREFYARAVPPAGDRRALVAAEIMRAIYFDLLERIERRGYDVFSARVSVPKGRRVRLALAVLLRTRLGPR